MSILNQPREPFYDSDEERERAAIAYLPVILSFAPEYLDFDFSNLVLKYLKTKKDDKEEFEKMMDIQDAMENILLRNHFAEISREGNMLRILTNRGRDLRTAGSLQRHKEKEEEKQRVIFNSHSINIGGNNNGNVNTGHIEGKQEVNNLSTAQKNEKDNPMPFYKQDWFRRIFFPLLVALIAFLTKIYYDKYVSQDQKQNKELPSKDTRK